MVTRMHISWNPYLNMDISQKVCRVDITTIFLTKQGIPLTISILPLLRMQYMIRSLWYNATFYAYVKYGVKGNRRVATTGVSNSPGDITQ